MYFYKILFVLLFCGVRVFCGEYILTDYVSAGLSECINIGFWDTTMMEYLDPVPYSRRPVAGTHPWPPKMSSVHKKVFTEGDGFIVGVPFISFAPNTYWDADSGKWRGYEIDLLEGCVLPLIRDEYDIGDFSYDIRILPQHSYYFFDSILERLNNNEAHLMTSISNKATRRTKVDFSQHHFLSGVNCVRSKYDEELELETRDQINEEGVKIIAQSGAIYDFMSENFGEAEIAGSTEDLLAVMLENPEYHLYCTAIEQVLYWYRIMGTLADNYTRYESDVIGELSDILAWALKKEDRSSSSVWWISLIIVPLTCLGCCAVCALCLVMVFGSILFLILGMLFSSVVFCAIFQQQRIKYYAQLKDFDILLEEQKASGLKNDGSIVKVKMRDDLFSIPYESIQLIREIGRGGSGAAVYKAKYNNTVVAFKVFGIGLINRENIDTEPFEKELRMMVSVNNPHILRFFGASLRPPRIGIVMEFCENGSLHSFIDMITHNQTSLETNEKIRILKEISVGMEYLHSRKICHRDLKCDNVLLDELMCCKICDFGSSRFLTKNNTQLTQGGTSFTSDNLTQRIGTSFFMAPEVVLGKRYTQSCDVFSFAIVAWIVMNEDLDPYQRSKRVNLEYGIEQMVAQSPDFRPKIPQWMDEEEEEGKERGFDEDDELNDTNKKWLWDMIVKCWDHNPKQRPNFSQLVHIFTSRYDVEKGEKAKKRIVEEKLQGGQRGSVRFTQSSSLNPRIEIQIMKEKMEKKIKEIERLKKVLKKHNINIKKEEDWYNNNDDDEDQEKIV